MISARAILYLNGFEATKKIRKIEREDTKIIPIIAISANAYDGDVELSFQSGMIAHLVKPVDPQKLYATLISVMNTNDE